MVVERQIQPVEARFHSSGFIVRSSIDDTGKAGKNAHRSTALAYMGSAVQGHTHRMAYEVTGTFDGTPYLAAMLGWLGDRKAADYMHEVGAAEWVHGMGIGHMERDTGIVHVQPIPFVNGKCVVNGELVSAGP